MSQPALGRGGLIAGIVISIVLGFPQTSRADLIDAGFDLFDPQPGSLIFVPALGRLVPVVGVTISSFPDFGPVGLGNTNSILQRFDSVSDSGPSQTPIEMRAMQLMSTDGSNLFFTLQAAVPSLGTMDVTFGPTPGTGTFTWDIDVFLNVLTGSFGGPLFTSFGANLNAGPTPWSHIPPPSAVCIPQVNCLYNGTNANDFYPI